MGLVAPEDRKTYPLKAPVSELDYVFIWSRERALCTNFELFSLPDSITDHKSISFSLRITTYLGQKLRPKVPRRALPRVILGAEKYNTFQERFQQFFEVSDTSVPPLDRAVVACPSCRGS